MIRRKTSKRWRETEHPVIVPDRTHLEVSTLSVGLSGMHLSVARGTNLGRQQPQPRFSDPATVMMLVASQGRRLAVPIPTDRMDRPSFVTCVGCRSTEMPTVRSGKYHIIEIAFVFFAALRSSPMQSGASNVHFRVCVVGLLTPASPPGIHSRLHYQPMEAWSVNL